MRASENCRERAEKIHHEAEKIMDCDVIRNRSTDIQRRRDELKKGSMERKKIIELQNTLSGGEQDKAAIEKERLFIQNCVRLLNQFRIIFKCRSTLSNNIIPQ